MAITEDKSAAHDGERHFKAGGADIRTKVIVITENAHKYRISAMCKCLKVSRSSYYYVSSSHEKIKVFKTEFIKGRNFDNLQQLQLELADYIHWFNHIRMHGSLHYLSPVEFRRLTL